ncbi:MAG: hypothetical protein E7034_01910 [Akkermansiaceae bacterium]|nr:hypothetical protein [Akkermansiaceae bacterium]
MSSVLLSAAPLSAQDSLPSHITNLFDSYVKLPDSLVPVLRSVNDKDGATAAAPKLRAELEKLYAIRESLRKVSSLTPQQNELVRNRYEQAMREQWGKVYTEMFRLQREKCYGSAEFTRLYRIMCMMLDK